MDASRRTLARLRHGPAPATAPTTGRLALRPHPGHRHRQPRRRTTAAPPRTSSRNPPPPARPGHSRRRPRPGRAPAPRTTPAGSPPPATAAHRPAPVVGGVPVQQPRHELPARRRRHRHRTATPAAVTAAPTPTERRTPTAAPAARPRRPVADRQPPRRPAPPRPHEPRHPRPPVVDLHRPHRPSRHRVLVRPPCASSNVRRTTPAAPRQRRTRAPPAPPSPDLPRTSHTRCSATGNSENADRWPHDATADTNDGGTPAGNRSGECQPIPSNRTRSATIGTPSNRGTCTNTPTTPTARSNCTWTTRTPADATGAPTHASDTPRAARARLNPSGTSPDGNTQPPRPLPHHQQPLLRHHQQVHHHREQPPARNTRPRRRHLLEKPHTRQPAAITHTLSVTTRQKTGPRHDSSEGHPGPATRDTRIRPERTRAPHSATRTGDTVSPERTRHDQFTTSACCHQHFGLAVVQTRFGTKIDLALFSRPASRPAQSADKTARIVPACDAPRLSSERLTERHPKTQTIEEGQVAVGRPRAGDRKRCVPAARRRAWFWNRQPKRYGHRQPSSRRREPRSRWSVVTNEARPHPGPRYRRAYCLIYDAAEPNSGSSRRRPAPRRQPPRRAPPVHRRTKHGVMSPNPQRTSRTSRVAGMAGWRDGRSTPPTDEGGFRVGPQGRGAQHRGLLPARPYSNRSNSGYSPHMARKPHVTARRPRWAVRTRRNRTAARVVSKLGRQVRWRAEAKGHDRPAQRGHGLAT